MNLYKLNETLLSIAQCLILLLLATIFAEHIFDDERSIGVWIGAAGVYVYQWKFYE